MSNYVLVHGAWSDASAWDEAARLLRGDGHQVAAPDLPAHGKDTTDPALATLDGYTAADRCVPPAAQQEMLDALPVAATRTVPAAHLAILSHPEQVTAAITELTA